MSEHTMKWDEYKKAIESGSLLQLINKKYNWGISDAENIESKIPSNFCVAPFKNMEITVSGTNRPCCKYDGFKKDDPEETVKIVTLDKLYNNEEMNSLREQFMRNEKPEKCKICWDEEKNNIISLRNIYNLNWLNNPNQGREGTTYKNFCDAFIGQPSTLDVKLSNLCNLKCRICGPWSSTQWIKDFKDLGWADKRAIKVWTENAKEKFFVNEENCKILVDWANGLSRVEFYGGEPMMQQEHDQIIDIMINSGSSFKQDLCYNTNGTHFSDELVKKWKEFDFVVVNFSIDDIGKRFEYQRKNAIYKDVISNLENYKLLSELYGVDGRYYLYITVSNYNIYYLDEMLKELAYLEFEVVFNLLHHPEYSCITNLPNHAKKIITEKLKNFDDSIIKFHKQSVYVKDILNFMNSKEMDKDKWHKFLTYNKSVDDLRDETFKNIFPEFYAVIKHDIPRML